MASDLLTTTPTAGDERALLAASEAAWVRSAPSEGAELALAAAQAAEAVGNHVVAAEARSMLALHQVRLGELEVAVSNSQQAICHFALQGSSAARSRAHSALSLAYERAGLRTLAVSQAATALAMAREVADLSAECWALIRLGVAADDSEEQHGMALLYQALDLARQEPGVDDETLFTALNNLSRRLVVEADRRVLDPGGSRAALQSALPLAEEAVRHARPGFTAATAAANLGGIHRRLGNEAEARLHFEQALAESRLRGYAGLAGTITLALASLDFETDASQAHQQALAAALETISAGVDPDLALQSRRTLVEGCRTRGDYVAALAHMERLHTEVMAAQARRSDLQTRLLFNNAELEQARHVAERARISAELERLRADAEHQTALRLAMDRELLEREVAARTIELQRATAAAQALSRAKSTFLSIVSHELRTPLNGLIGMLQLASLGAADPRQSRQLDTATSAARQLGVLIESILSYVDADSSAPGLPTDVDLRALLRKALQARESSARARGLEMQADCAAALPEVLRVDAERLRQILDTLLDNVLKFSSPGPVQVRADWLLAGPGAGQLQLSVADSGPGLEPELLQRLFNPFEPGDGSHTRAHGGLGLGLALAQRLAHSLGGDLGFEPNPPGGSRFRVRVPVNVDDKTGNA